MIADVLNRLLDPRTLRGGEARELFDRLLAPGTLDLERAALLVALAGRPLDARELAHFAREMRRRATPFRVPEGDRPVDLCGSGGAPTPSFNVSTVSSFVVAASGVPVVKHGNRSASGVCGSSDLLEALGLPVTAGPDFAEASYRARKLAFLHAPLYHPATKAVVAVRRALGIPTVFNRLGPLSNPGGVPFQIAGAPTPSIARVFALVLGDLGVRRGASMVSVEGCDEFSPHRPTLTYVWNGGGPRLRRIRPETVLAPGERRGSWGPLPPAEAAREAERVLAGGSGARRGAVLLTAGVALWITGTAGSVADGVERARSVLDSGMAADALEELRAIAEPLRGSGPA